MRLDVDQVKKNMDKVKEQFMNYQSGLQIYKASPLAKIPMKATEESAGYDLYTVESGTLLPGETKIFSIGLIMRPPTGFHIKVWGRSGWGKKYGVGIPHGMGLVDRDFCGPDDVMQVVLHRALTREASQEPLIIEAGDRIAQMTIEPTVILINPIEELDAPPATISRGGFGSSGVK